MIDNVRAEASVAIEAAWNDGYKAGVLEYAPEAEGLRVMTDSLRKESDRFVVPLWHIPVWTTAGLTAGFLTGYVVRMVQ